MTFPDHHNNYKKSNTKLDRTIQLKLVKDKIFFP